ncbi:MAG TPA: hypothetical protein VFK61_01800 [Candidatus Limnocylindria bacterium]|nr:hypothetical protein [Candidatus Limnocylindria bacterium]
MTPLLPILLLTLVGCSALIGRDVDGGNGGGGNGVSGAGPGAGDKPIVGGGGGGAVPPVGDGALREEPDPTVVDAQPVPADHFAIGPDGRTVVVYWWGGTPNCFGLRRVDITIADGMPMVTPFEGVRAAAQGKACTAEAVLKSAVVTLEEPVLADAANQDPDPGEPALLGQALAVTPMGGVLDPRPHAITGWAVSSNGRTLQTYYVGGTEDCYALASAAMDWPEGGPLTVDVREGRRPDVDGACDDMGLAKMVELSLDAPLITDGTD